MNRREFLKLGGVLATALLLPFDPFGSIALRPIETDSQGNRFLGSTDGKILISADHGKTWQLHTDFGADFSILSLTTDLLGQVRAELVYAGNPFELALVKNSKIWKTI